MSRSPSKRPDHALAYVPDGGSITINLNSADVWTVECFDPATNRSHRGLSLPKGSGTVTAPFTGDAVVLLVRMPSSPASL